ncbi:TolC family protein, partial [Methylopila musalis]
MAASLSGRAPRLLTALGVSSMLAGCATLSPDAGMAPVTARVALELGQDTAKLVTPAEAAVAQARVRALLAKPLTAEAAAQIALLNNRGLQAAYNTLGVAEADYVAASLPPSPTLSIERVAASGDLDVERRLVADLLSLITLPRRTKIAETSFRAAQQRAIAATFRTASDARRAWTRAVAARETADALETARSSATVAAELSARL